MWWLQNKSNALNVQKWSFWKSFQMMSINQLVIIVVMISLVSAKMEYPPEKDQLVAKDDNTLITNKFLPFLDQCATANAEIEICSMYFDMVSEVYSLGLNGKEIKNSILEGSKLLNNPKLIESFCEIFRNESAIALDKQPFSKKNGINNITEWIQSPKVCDLSCMYLVRGVVMIKDVCKFISGGLRAIIKEKARQQDLKILQSTGTETEKSLNANGETNAKTTDEKKNSKTEVNPNEQGTNTNTIQKSVQTSQVKSVPISTSNANSVPISSTNTKSNQNSPSPSSTKALQTPVKTSEIAVPIENVAPAVQVPPKSDVTQKITKNNESNVDANKKVNSGIDTIEPNNEHGANKQASVSSLDVVNGDEEIDKNPNEFNNIEYPNEDNGGEEEETDHVGDLEQPENPKNPDTDSRNANVNSMQKSRLYTDQVAFREDTESSFFPYFMFLMFVVVSLYVAYHNKSKILALMIEGRRSRNYTSRNGGRRKHSSAEYRKLDSNLEEAIQSEGGHVLSTQIIY